MRKKLFAAFLITCVEAWSLELAPWYPEMFEIHPFVRGLTQHSSCVDSPKGDFDRHLHANYLEGGVYAAAFDWAGELNVLFGESSYRSFGFDRCMVTGRYQIWDDVALVDPVSIIASFSLSSASRIAVDDIASFHHGKCEAMAHISIGKEFPCAQFWLSRFWSAVGIGIADVGSPWWHLHFCAEKNVLDTQRWRIFMDSLVGCGGQSLFCTESFHGYGPIAHRSIDLGIDYRYSFECGVDASLIYSYRIYSQNFPKDTSSLSVFFVYPFGL